MRIHQLLITYQKFFKLYEELRDKSDTHEMVLGVGLFHYKKDNDNRKYYRHIITQAVNIKYSQSAIIVQVSDENPKIEKDFISKEFSEISINGAIEYFDSIVKDENKDDIDLLDSENITQILQEIGNQIGIEQYSHQTIKPKISEKQIISYSPALTLRKKNTSKLDEAYTKIIEQIEQQGDSCNIGLINSLLGKNNDSNTSNPSDNYSLPEIVYFPNPSNNEQIKILEKSRNNNAVMVQGPPGTGKSHTIANLICHLLATGNKVLATAYTKRALEVLKDKLPKKYQGLAVDYLGNDQTSKDNLTTSVNTILNNINNSQNYDTNLDEQQLKTTKEKTAKYINKNKDIIRHDTEKITINANYQGMLVETFEQLKSDKKQFSWYQDNYDDVKDIQLQEQLGQFIVLNKKHQLQKISDFESIVSLAKIPTPAQVERYNELTGFSTLEDKEIVKSNNLDALSTSLKNINNLSKQIQALYQEQSLDNFINLSKKSSELGKLFNTLPEQKTLEELDNTKISYPEKDLKILKAHANDLLKFLEDGGKLQDLGLFARWRLPINIKEQYYFVDAVRVNDSPCDTVDEFMTVIADIETKQIFQKLQSIHFVNHNGYIEQINAYQNIVDNVNKFKEIKIEADTLVGYILHDSGLGVEYLKSNNIDELLERIEWTDKNDEWQKIDEIINKAQTHLNIKKLGHNADNWIDFKQNDKYQEFYQQTKNLNDFKELQQQLSQKIPHTIEKILAGEITTCEQLSNAIYHKHAQNYINKLPQENTATLKQKIKQNQEEEKRLITKIGANKAWQDVVNNINDSLQTELKLWQDAVGKISNSNSKRTQKYRKIAKQKMTICKDVIPCWIMPLQQLVDTIIPKQGMYDYIIVDEASQLDIDAILLLYLAKKIIIVGDKEQIAPENISADKSQVENAINKHLKNIPNKEFYDTEHSFFDLANIHFHTNITLREHFRCMPEIIEFSNKLCYAPNNTPLHPLRTYSEERLTPLKNVFCSNGNTEGKSSNIVNHPEAQAIVEKIAEIIKNEKYQNKTIGVITLQGNAQKEIIHNLLLEKIDTEQYQSRKIIVGNAAELQGDERDIIFLSLVTAINHNRTALTKDTDKRRFNVAASRAKDQLWLFHSVQLSDLKNHNDLRYKLLEHITTYTPEKFVQSQLILVPSPKPMYGDDPKPPKPFRSWFEVEVYNDILTKNYQVTPAYKVANYEIDLVPICADGTKIAVECDGDYWHDDEQYDEDMQRQDVLERAGWQFFRIRYSAYISDKYQATQGLWDLLKQHSVQQTKEDLDVSTTASEIIPVQEDSFTADTPKQQAATPVFFNLYQSGDYIVANSNNGYADLVVKITDKYKNGYLLQCYDNGHVNKFDASILLTKRQDKIYKNGFNVKTNQTIPKLILIEKDEIISITYNEAGIKKFQCHLTEKLPIKDNLSIQGYKVVYCEKFYNIKYGVIAIEEKNNISKLISGFSVKGKDMANSYYKKEWQKLGQLQNTDNK